MKNKLLTYYNILKYRLTSIPSDKYLHTITCILLTGIISMILRLIGLDRPESVIFASLSTIELGVLKELLDKYLLHGDCSLKDFIADLIGVITGSIIIL